LTSQIFVTTSNLVDIHFTQCTVILGATLTKRRNINCKGVLDFEALCINENVSNVFTGFFYHFKLPMAIDLLTTAVELI